MDIITILNMYREAQISEASLVLQNSPVLCELVVAWTKTHQDNFNPPPEALSLQELWASTKIDYGALEEATMLSPIQIIRGVEQLKRYNIILPDGTINKIARAIINNIIMANIKVPLAAKE